jgi:hypothetical protein
MPRQKKDDEEKDSAKSGKFKKMHRSPLFSSYTIVLPKYRQVGSGMEMDWIELTECQGRGLT